MKFDFYSDPGHGWVRVPMKLIKKLNIQKDISVFSYVKGDNIYLEEDNDLTTFIKAMKKVGKTVELREHHTDRVSKIRKYKIYKIN
jgi:predicted acyltransferase (DUF342 family)